MLNQSLPIQVTHTEPLLPREFIRLGGCTSAMGLNSQRCCVGRARDLRGERINGGSTGSGKSTTVDLLMGLLVPTAGSLLVMG